MRTAAETDLLPWILVGILVVVVAVAFIAMTHIRAAPPRPASPHFAGAVPAADAPVAPIPARQAPHTTPANQVWECKTNGATTYSDHPCARDPVRREIRTPNLMDAVPVNSDAATETDQSAAEVPVGDEPSRFDPNVDSPECANLRAEAKNIYEAMREGYPSEEGDYYRAQLRRISARQFDLNCVR